MNWFVRLVRWLLNKDELDAIKNEVRLLRLLVACEIERREPKRHEALGPIGPVRNR